MNILRNIRWGYMYCGGCGPAMVSKAVELTVEKEDHKLQYVLFDSPDQFTYVHEGNSPMLDNMLFNPEWESDNDDFYFVNNSGDARNWFGHDERFPYDDEDFDEEEEEEDSNEELYDDSFERGADFNVYNLGALAMSGKYEDKMVWDNPSMPYGEADGARICFKQYMNEDLDTCRMPICRKDS